MKKTFFATAIALSALLIACSGGGKDSAESIAKKWCDLNGKVARATTDEEREKAKEKREEYENTMDAKYKNDTAMQRMIAAEVEKCEDASEGRE